MKWFPRLRRARTTDRHRPDRCFRFAYRTLSFAGARRSRG